MNENTQTELRARARKMAELRIDTDHDLSESLTLIPFRLGTETYGIEQAFIRQVYPLRQFIPVPGVPEFVLGITYIQGRIYSVLDLKALFSLPEGGLTNQNHLLILEWEEMCFGILADEVYGARKVSLGDLSEAEDWKGSNTHFIRGVTPDPLVVIDAKTLISDPHLVVDQTQKNEPQES